MLAGYRLSGMGCASCPSRGLQGCSSCAVRRRYGVGDAMTDALLAPAMTAMLPKLQEIVAKSAEASEPMIRRVVVEDVLPKFGTALVISLVAGAAVAASIGAYFATRRR